MAFTVMMVAAAAALVGFVVYLDAQGPAAQDEVPEPATASTAAPTTTYATTTTLPEHASTTTMYSAPETTASTTTTLKTMTVDYQPKNIYLEDDVNVTARDGQNRILDVALYLDGVPLSESDYDIKWIRSLEGGSHTVTVAADGYYNATFNLTASKTTYSGSRDVRHELTVRERSEALAAGKADFRFYDSPNCPNCRAVLSYLGRIIDKNRDCVVYEKLWVYDHPQELQVFFGKSTVQFPLIIVDGPLGTSKTQGIVSANHIRDMISQTTGCEVQ